MMRRRKIQTIERPKKYKEKDTRDASDSNRDTRDINDSDRVLLLQSTICSKVKLQGQLNYLYELGF